MAQKVKKALIPAAGYGTRFLPATKALPKEMLPVVDKPVIQYIVEDAVSAGAEDIIVVTGWFKKALEDHFDYPFELETRLSESGKTKELESIRKIADVADFFYLRQRGPLGNGTPVLNAKDLIGEEPFFLLSADDIFEASPSRCQQLMEVFEKYNAPVIATIKKGEPEDYKRYGFVEGEEIEPGLIKVSKIVEKPGPGKTNSQMAVVFSGIFTPDLFPALQEARAEFDASGRKDEFVIWEGVNKLLAQGKPLYAKEIQNGKYYDCGNKLEYMKANIEFGLKDQELGKDFAEYIKNLKV